MAHAGERSTMSTSELELPDAHTDPETREAIHEQLMEAFLAAPEGISNPTLREAGCNTEEIKPSVWTLLGFMQEFLDVHLATLDSAGMESLLLDICPRNVLLPPSLSPRKFLLILEAFWRFLDRVYEHPHAPAVLERLPLLADTFEQRMGPPRSAENPGARPAAMSPFLDLTEAFDLHALDDEEELDEDLWEDYLDGLIHHFRASPEGLSLEDSGLDHINWLRFYLKYARPHTLPPGLKRLTTELVLMEDLPRKVTPNARSTPEDIVPGLIAFWQYLQRVHEHPAAGEVLEYLHARGLAQQFRKAMYDPARGGPAKNFFMAGERAGYDMSDPQQSREFQIRYNDALHSDPSMPGLLSGTATEIGDALGDNRSGSGPPDPRRKHKRKAAKAARKANKQKKKKK